MANRVVIDPITRIEGHLRVEVEVKDGKVVDAYSSGHDGSRLRDHPEGTRSARCVGVLRTRLRRLHDGARAGVGPHRGGRARHHRAAQRGADSEPDVLRAVHAGPRRALLSPARAGLGGRGQRAQGRPEEDLGAGAEHLATGAKSSPGYFSDLQKRLKGFVESGQLGIFANGYWGHPAYKLPPEANLMAVAHYLDALEWQKEIVKVHTIFGGKNPHPNYLVGGVPCALNLDENNAINAERLAYVGALFDQAQAVRRTGLHPRPAGRRVLLQGLGRQSAADSRITWRTATCRCTATATSRSSSSRAASS